MTSEKSDTEADVVIVGAGLSGLSAAYFIHKRDPTLSVTILEAKDRLGGRTIGMTALTASGMTDNWDLGAQWVGKCQPSVMKLLEELDMKTFPQYANGKKLMQLVPDGKVSSYINEIPSLPILSLLDLSLFLYKIDRMTKQIDINNPEQSKRAEEWDGITLEEFKRRHLWTRASSEVIDAACRCIFGADSSHISLLYYLTYLRGAGGIEPLISSKEKFGGQELRIQDGAWSICQKLHQSMPKVKILYNRPVSTIVQCEADDTQEAFRQEVKVRVETVDGSVVRCKRVILAIPPHLTASISFTPLLPLEKSFVMNRMPCGHLTKIICTYSKTFWRNAGLSGEVVTSGGRSYVDGCSRGPLCVVMDATSFNGHPALVCFIGGTQQLEYSSLSLADRRRAVLMSLAEFFGPEALSPTDYLEKNWNEERYNGGCPVSVGTPGMMTRFAPALRQPFNMIHFAGTESATVWCGFLNGAVQSGQRAAAEVLYNLRSGLLSSEELCGTAYDTSKSSAVCRPSCVRKSNFWPFVGTGAVVGGVAVFVLWKLRAVEILRNYR